MVRLVLLALVGGVPSGLIAAVLRTRWFEEE